MTPGPRRVLVLGNAGSGKSTLARQLGPPLGLDVIHLDVLYWGPGWTQPSHDEWAEILAEIVTADRWVLDGNYNGTIESRLARADAVVLLDLPRPLCLWGVVKRRVRFHGRTRPDAAGGCPERIDWAFLKWIWTYPRRSGRALLQRLGDAADRRPTYVLRSRRQVRDFAAAVGRGTGDWPGRLHKPPDGVPVRRRSWRGVAVAAGVLLAALAVVDHRVGRPADDWARYDHRTFAVTAVDDGVRLDDGTLVHLLGTTDPVPAAAGWLAGHVLGRRVTLLLPTVGVRDPAGRLAAYVYADDGACLNVALVKDGLAYAERRSADPLAGLIDPAEADARRNGRGLWAGLRFDQMPPWRQAWLRGRAR